MMMVLCIVYDDDDCTLYDALLNLIKEKKKNDIGINITQCYSEINNFLNFSSND